MQYIKGGSFDMKIISSPFSIAKSNGMVIRGRELHRDDCPSCCRPVIICHGFTSDMSKTAADGESFAAQGYRAFIFDFCGGGYHTSSDGSFEDYMTPLTEKEDLLAVIDYVRKRQDCIPGMLILMGCSMGGFVCALAAAEIPDKISKMILYYPALCIPDHLREGRIQDLTFDPANIPDHIGTSPKRVSGKFASSVMDMNIYDILPAYQGPVLIVHGTEDQIVPIEFARRAKEAYGDQAELAEIKNGPHGFHEEPYFSEAAEAALAFAKRS